MSLLKRAVATLVSASILLLAGFAYGGDESKEFTAQNKPRIAIEPFYDTNKEARDQMLGTSVSAMLITHMKKKSQFVVIERDNLSTLIEEWELERKGRNEHGDLEKGDILIRSIDAIIM
jgi:curli biogenesis system outer membrane secretion channel CsgG